MPSLCSAWPPSFQQGPEDSPSSAARATQAVQLLIVSKPPGGDPSIAYQLGNQDLWKTFFNLTSLFEFIA